MPETDPSSIAESRFPAPSRSQFGDLSPFFPLASRTLQQTRVSRHEARNRKIRCE
ncbi:hypothetical protein P692DRAFT_20337706 [Suillus brevipes Sb2]|nr:hypothetical protein P692DRAFT_20337706 [Suillus brevipes Sb2]